MNQDEIKKVLHAFASGSLSEEDTLQKLQNLPYENLDFVKLDHHRSIRRGFPEVIYCSGKSPQQVAMILGRMQNYPTVLATRASQEMYDVVKDRLPSAVYHEVARLIEVRNGEVAEPKNLGTILVVSAGTSDIPVAEESFITAKVMGNKVEKLYDVGVAGLHRLLDNHNKLRDANVIIVVAGMDGALPSVVTGLVSRPVIAVPTSVGYGTSFSGVAPLLSMLNACAPGLSVVNIDNGFGAGYTASLINSQHVEQE